jgi:hypothetical protein
MHPEIASVLAQQRHQELTRQADRQRAVACASGSRRHAPRYRVHWSRTTLAPAGRRERSWVIVISASRSL